MNIRTIVMRLLLTAAAAVVVCYLADMAWFYARLHSGTATSKVHRTRMLAIPHKDGKVEFQIDSNQPEEDLPCARSLFPHGGMNACWYVTKHANDPIVM